jgi:hypothetical protein
MLDNLYAFQQVMVGAYVRNLMVCAALAYLVVQQIRRERAAPPGAGVLQAAPRPQSTDVVSIASRSFGPRRGREIKAQTAGGALLSYRAFADRVKRGMAPTSSSRQEHANNE